MKFALSILILAINDLIQDMGRVYCWLNEWMVLVMVKVSEIKSLCSFIYLKLELSSCPKGIQNKMIQLLTLLIH